MRRYIDKLNRLRIPEFILVEAPAREEYARFVKLILHYNSGRKDLMDEKTVNSAWAEVVHDQLDIRRRHHWMKQSSPTHFRYAEIWRSISSPAKVKAGLESEYGAKGYVHLAMEAYPDANSHWIHKQAIIEQSSNLLPLATIMLRRGRRLIGSTRTYLARLDRERRWNEDAEKLAFSAAVFLRYGSFILKNTRQAFATAKHLATKLEQEDMMRKAAALKDRDESELADVMKLWSLTQQTKGSGPGTLHYDLPTAEVALAPWRTAQTPS